MKITIEIEREDDGRYIAEIPEFPGCLTYGKTHLEAISKVSMLAIYICTDAIKAAYYEAYDIHAIVLQRGK